jgi:cytochrome b
VPVWDRPLRLWHWALAVFVLIAWFTPNRHDGLHRVAGYVVIGLLIFRLAWGFLGTRYSRFRRLVPKLRAAPAYLWGLRRGKTGRYLGLNPAGAAMLVALLAALTISAVTGAMQVTVSFFGVWWVEDTHAWSSDAVIVLVVLHVAGTILMSVLQRENLPRAMITGRKHRRGH